MKRVLALILAFFIGSCLGGAIAGLPFDMEGFKISELVCCIVSKMLLIAVFVPIYLTMSVIAKQKSWLSLLLSLMVGMFLFMMIPMLSPLNSTVMNILLCLAGGALFGSGLGCISNQILRKTSLI